MRIAIIDLGTNSVRFDIQHVGPGRHQVRQLHREKIMVRLGQGVFLNGRLDRTAVQRTLHAFLRFRKAAQHYKVGKIIAFGTSALREVSDGERFLKQISDKSGIDVRVISGAEEAQLIALGVLSNEKVPKGRFALVDIGGGSTEVSICRGSKILHSMSFPLGTARLQQVFLKKSPPSAANLEQLRNFIRGTLAGVVLTQRWPRVDRVIGSSGTIKALARIIEGGEWKEFDRDALRERVEEMSRMTTTELLGMSGIEAKRVDMILAGAVLFEECMNVLGARKAVATQFSLRDGVLEEELKLLEQGNLSHLSLHLSDLREKALQFTGDPAHLDRMVKVADFLFDRLLPVHRLDPGWKIYLLAAVLLRDTGQSISLSRFPEHSYYIVKHADFPAADVWETEFIAELCRYHEGTKLSSEALLATQAMTKPRREAFLKLLATLRVVDALDSGPETHLKLREVKIHPKKILLTYGGRGLTGLEALNVEKKAPFFQNVMKRGLVVRKG